MMTVVHWFSKASRISLLALAVGALALGQSSARAAFVLDLTTHGSSGSITGTVGGAALFQQIDHQSTGTGVIDSFVRLQHNGTEQGYNTDANPNNNGTVADTNDAGNTAQYNHSILLSDL